MRIVTEERRIGENLGPIDWSYDFTSHDWSSGLGGVNPEVSRDGAARLREVEAALSQGQRVTVMMHQNYHEVITVGMYDGWPFWRPVPSVLTQTCLGGEWSPWYNIQGVEVRP